MSGRCQFARSCIQRVFSRLKGAITMNTTVTNATEYRDLPLAMLTESTTNPRCTFAEDTLKELAASIRTRAFFRL
jgi:hypothetical protein